MKLHDFNQKLKRDMSIEVPNDQDFVAKVVSMSTVEPQIHPRSFVLRFAPVMAAFLIVVVASVSLFLHQEVDSVISVDINPSIQLALNAQGDVINITSEEVLGESLIQAMSLKKGDLNEVLHRLLDASISLGYGTGTDTTMLFGVDAETYEKETELAVILDTWSQAQSVRSLTLLSHTDVLTRYSGLVDETIQTEERTALDDFLDGFFAAADDSTTVMTTTTAWDGHSTDSIENNPDAIPATAWDAQVLSLSEFEELADSLGVSDTLMQLILLIVIEYPSYNTYDGFVALSQMSIAELLTLYGNPE
ncbi:MAG: hypothetical protein PHP32_06105 [Candidatus Izemoplasmatales bacterium]|nr:hypothetical protein [Candidatus Izemoplasmatales bacterium]